MITLLEAQKDCVKTHRWREDGWHTTAFDDPQNFEVHDVECNSIYQLHETLAWLEHQPRFCLIHAKLIAGMPRFGRRLLYDQADGAKARFRAPEGAEWLCLDIDNMPCPQALETGCDADVLTRRLEHIVSQLPADFQRTTFAYQWSASAGIKGWNPLKVHIFFWIDNPQPLNLIKDRAKAESWGCDPQPLSPVQIHYTAAPRFEGAVDPLAGTRTGLIRRERDAVTLSDWSPPPRQKVSTGERLISMGSGKKLSELLDAIGEGNHLHGPIRTAIGHYIVMTPPDERDRAWLKDQIDERVKLCCRTDANDYLDDDYFERLYSNADFKYQPLDTERMRLSLARQTLKKWKKKGAQLRK